MKQERDILDKIVDLHLQATTENSHYYTASVLREAAAEIMRLREELKKDTPTEASEDNK